MSSQSLSLSKSELALSLIQRETAQESILLVPPPLLPPVDMGVPLLSESESELHPKAGNSNTHNAQNATGAQALNVSHFIFFMSSKSQSTPDRPTRDAA